MTLLFERTVVGDIIRVPSRRVGISFLSLLRHSNSLSLE